jgi:ABC-type antimicrobial peptide transport system permease subunit
MRPVLIGVLAGMVISAALSHLLSALLFGLNPLDPLAFLGVSLLLSAITAVAAYIPARRATKVDPMVALRHE